MKDYNKPQRQLCIWSRDVCVCVFRSSLLIDQANTHCLSPVLPESMKW